jgi:hypothetical protein
VNIVKRDFFFAPVEADVPFVRHSYARCACNYRRRTNSLKSVATVSQSKIDSSPHFKPATGYRSKTTPFPYAGCS